MVKLKDGVSREELNRIRHGLTQFVNDRQIFIQDSFTVGDLFESMSAATTNFGYFVTVMILTLTFFMMTVSFSQKVRELGWESGVLRSIGLTKR